MTPFDKGQVKAIEKAIRESDLGLEPSAQGGVIRVPLPQMNEQRRKELVKVVHKLAEEGRIAIRHARTHARDELKKLNGVSEDDVKHAEKDLQKVHDDYIAQDRRAAEGAKKPRSWKSDAGDRARADVRARAPHPLFRRRRPPRAVHRARGGRATCGPARGRERTRCVGVLSHRTRLGHPIRSTTSASRSPDCCRSRSMRTTSGSSRVRLSLAAVVALAILAATIWLRGVEGRPLGAAAVTLLGVVYTAGMLSYGYAIRYHDSCAATTRSARASVARTAARSDRSRRRAADLPARAHLGLRHRRVLRRSGDRRTQADPVGEPGKDRGGGGGRLWRSAWWCPGCTRVRCSCPSRVSASRRGRRSASAPSSASPRRSATCSNRCSSGKAA